MGDFNDPFNIIGTNGLQLKNEKFTKGNTEIIKSCCYNVNSACPDNIWNITDDEVAKNKNKMIRIKNSSATDQKECAKPDLKGVGFGAEGEEEWINELKWDGELKNYRFAGDYVLGVNPVTTMKIYDTDLIYSDSSDHRMVYATFSERPTVGAPIGGSNKITVYNNGKKYTRVVKPNKRGVACVQIRGELVPVSKCKKMLPK